MREIKKKPVSVFLSEAIKEGFIFESNSPFIGWSGSVSWQTGDIIAFIGENIEEMLLYSGFLNRLRKGIEPNF